MPSRHEPIVVWTARFLDVILHDVKNSTAMISAIEQQDVGWPDPARRPVNNALVCISIAAAAGRVMRESSAGDSTEGRNHWRWFRENDRREKAENGSLCGLRSRSASLPGDRPT